MPPRKGQIRVISHSEMPISKGAAFQRAVDGLLAELIRSLDRHHKGEFHEPEEKPLARPAGHRRRTSE